MSRKAHAVMDYIVGILLIAAPWIFRFSDIGAAKWCAIAVGVLTLIMSVMTDYEGTGKKPVSMNAHLNTDVIVGIFLAISPWLFGFNDVVYLPHLVFGLLAIAAGLCTVRASSHLHTPGGMGMGHAH